MRESGPSLTEIGEWRYETVHHMGRRCWNWDYTERCIYEITVVLKDRRKGWLGCLRENTQTQDQRENARQEGVALGGFCRANSGRRVRDARWFVELTADGEAVVDALQEMPRRYPQVSLLEWQVMPEHVHFVVFVKEKLDRPFGALVRGFKAGAVKRWKSLRENAQTQDQRENAQTQDQRENAQTQDQRELVSTELPEWSEGFVDVILWRDGQLQAMLDYLADNPRRLAMKRADPGLFKRVVDLQIVLKIGDASSRCREELVGHFSAIGNRFLLEAPLAQVQVSRRFCRYRRITLPSGGSKIARDAGGEPIVELETPEYRARRDELLAAARHGAVLVSPCVSDGERQIAREALSAGMKLITMLNKGFSPLQKPTGRYFDACAEGRLLMIAPCAWPYVPGEKPMTRFEATAMNRLCQWIVGDGAAYINYHGMKPENIDELAIRSVCKEEAPSWR